MTDWPFSLLSTNAAESCTQLTVESLEAAIQVMKNQPFRHTPLILNSRMNEEFERIRRTKILKRIGNYALQKLDGHQWWCRETSINDGLELHSFPRDRGEGWSTWYVFNRHFRRRGFPKGTCDWSEVKHLIPALAKKTL